jgi:predicted dehydrogenase
MRHRQTAPTRIGIVSFAHTHAEAYARILLAMPDVELVGFVDDDDNRALDVATRLGLHRFDSEDALLAAAPEGVVVCTENSRHRRAVELSAEAGVGVLCEKPLATTVADAQAMVDVCARAEVVLMTAFPMRFNGPLNALRDVLRSGAAGRVRCFEGVNQGQLPRRHREWFVDPVLAGGGALTDHTVHLADVLRWIVGCEVAEVYAQTNQLLHDDSVTVETGGLVALGFTDGTIATIDCSWSRPDSYPTWGGLGLRVIADGGALAADAFGQTITCYDDSAKGLSWLPWGRDDNAMMLDEFLAALRDGRPAVPDGVDGYRAVQIVQAAYRSAATGQPVPVG